MKITMDEYTENALRTEQCDYDSVQSRLRNNCKTRLLHAALGLTTESGEFADAIKKNIFYGEKLDSVNLQEELGDLLWYIVIGANAIGVSLEEIAAKNIAKLKVRYPDKFKESKAIDRDLDSERETLEGKK